MARIVFLDAYSIADSSLHTFEALGEFTAYEDTTPQEVVERCQGAEIVITNKVKLMRAEIDALPSLKLICVAATGTNNIDTHYAKEKGVEVRNVAGYSTDSVAEATISMVLALMRQVPFYNDFVHSGKYSEGTRCFNLDRPIGEVRGKRWGIIAMGAIGRRVAEIASALSAEVCYYSTSGANLSQGYKNLELDELLRTSDIITIHAPLNDKTQNLISERELNLMQQSSIIVNVGRGGIIDEVALATALNECKIAGAALDVFEAEPTPINNPLLSLEDPYKLIVAPHCGWSSGEARATLIEGVAGNIKDFLAL